MQKFKCAKQSKSKQETRKLVETQKQHSYKSASDKWYAIWSILVFCNYFIFDRKKKKICWKNDEEGILSIVITYNYNAYMLISCDWMRIIVRHSDLNGLHSRIIFLSFIFLFVDSRPIQCT